MTPEAKAQWAQSNRDRAEWYGADCIKWLQTFKRLSTMQKNHHAAGNNFTVKNASNEAVLSARSAARFANRYLDSIGGAL